MEKSEKKKKQAMQKELYRLYQLDWMARKGCSLDDLCDAVVKSCNDQATDFANEAWDDPDARPDMSFSVCDAFRAENGTAMKNFTEFLSGEYRDPACVQRLLAMVLQTEQRQKIWAMYCEEYYESHRNDPDLIVYNVDGCFAVTVEVEHRTHISGCYTGMLQARQCLCNTIEAWMMSEAVLPCPLQAIHEIATIAGRDPKKAASIYAGFEVDDNDNLVYTGIEGEKVYFAIQEFVISR